MRGRCVVRSVGGAGQNGCMPQPRWDGDDRFAGVGDARQHLGALEQLSRLAGTAEWIAEDPGSHLGQHVREAAAEAGLRWVDDAVLEDATYEVRLSVPAELDRRRLRRAAWRLIGAIAESSTHVREQRSGNVVTFGVLTGMPHDSDGFAAHGHTVRLVLTQDAQGDPAD